MRDMGTPHETTSFDPVQPCRAPNGLVRSIRHQWGPERNAFAGLVSELTEVAGPAFFSCTRGGRSSRLVGSCLGSVADIPTRPSSWSAQCQQRNWASGALVQRAPLRE